MSKWHLKKKKIEARRLEKRLRKAKQHKKKNSEWGEGKGSRKARQKLENAKKKRDSSKTPIILVGGEYKDRNR